MKKFILLLVIGFVINNPISYSQSISGKVSVAGFSKDGTIKEQSPVELFKSFKENKFKIYFSFKSTAPEKNSIVLFDMKTTVKKNGKVIGTSSRPGWPWLPGDMFVPAEAFDFIPQLQKDGERIKKGDKMNKFSGSYEIILEMIVSPGQETFGSIAPATISFKL